MFSRVSRNNAQRPFVVAIDENFNTLIGDIERAFPSWSNPSRASGSPPTVMELSVSWGQPGYDRKDGNGILQKENMVAVIRLPKSRNGQDMTVANIF